LDLETLALNSVGDTTIAGEARIGSCSIQKDARREGGLMTAERGRDRIERGQKRVRGFLHGELVFDTKEPRLVWELPYFPTYYVPEEDVAAGLVASGETKSSPSRGDAELLDVKVNGALVHHAAHRYPDSPIEELRSLVRFEWNLLDEWLEEDEPIYTHPRDPYTRLDILHSSRHVEIVMNGVKVAETDRPTILFETGLPPRYYLPLTDVRIELLIPSEKQTHCPYKGTANYYSLEVDGRIHEDFVWIYRSPLPESQKIAGLVAFFNEKVDLYVDGELQDRPQTKFG
jgi:uncharacterized protein (DUF427 family)